MSARLREKRAAESRLRVFRDDIQGIRGLAVLMVVLHHIGFAVYGGVDMSFVLSGYLATDGMLRAAEKDDTFTARWYVTKFVPKYYARRVRRVMPLAAIVIIAIMVATVLMAPGFRAWTIGLDGLWAAVSGANYRFATQGTSYLAGITDNTSPVQHYWSLAVEEQFYLLFPWLFMLLFLLGRQLGKTRLVLGVGLLALGAASLYASVDLSAAKATQPWAYFSLHSRAWELLIGCLVAVAARQFARMWLPFAAIMSWGGLAVLGVGSVFIYQTEHTTGAIPGAVMLWPTIGVAMFIAGGCANPWYGAEFLLGTPTPTRRIWAHLARAVSVVPRTFQYLGRVSYGWYLWHWAPLVLIDQAIDRELTVVERTTIVLLTLVIAIVSNKVVETPIKRAKHLTEFPSRAFRLGYRFVIAALLAVGVTLALSYTGAEAKKDVAPVNPAYIPALLQESMATRQLPASAEKQLGYIKTDLFPRCIVDVPETQAKSCNLGDASGREHIVLFGNSLAWQWIPAVNKLARDEKSQLTVIAKAGCPPENYDITVLDRKSNQDYSECTPWRKHAYDKIGQLRPKLVILSSRAEKQVTPQAIRDAVAHFQGLGARVIVVLETPYAEFGKNDDVPECVNRHRNSLDKCVTTLPPRPESAMVARVARDAGATVIDPTPWLCVDRRCPSVIDGKVVYWDDHHLTATMTQWLTRAFIEKAGTSANSKK